MKKLKLLALTAAWILFASITASAQKDSLPASYHELALDVAPIITRVYSPNVSSFLYRYHCGNGAIRARIDISLNNSTNTSNGTTTTGGGIPTTDTNNTNYKYNYSSFTLRAGYQHSYNTGRARFYMGLDGIFSYAMYDNTSTSTRTASGTETINTGEAKSSTIGLGIAPVAGVQYRMGRYFTLGIEEYIPAIYTDGQTTTTSSETFVPGIQNTINNSRTDGTNKGWTLTFNPVNNLSIFIGFKF